MAIRKDLTGKKFNKFEVIGFDKVKNRRGYWFCKCECGTIKSIETSHINRGSIKTCGCSWSSHNLTGTKLYEKWKSIKSRCFNQNHDRYKDYGGRGITVCEEWLNPENFVKWALENGYQEGLTIERVNVNGNYEPNNCIWITSQEQYYNKINTRKVIYNNNEYCLAEILNKLDLKTYYKKIEYIIKRENIKDITNIVNKLMEEK